MRSQNRILFRYLALALSCVAFFFLQSSQTAHSAVHPFHISWTELQWKAEKQTFEVSIKAHGLDLERALSQMSKTRVNLESTKQLNDLLKQYLDKQFFLIKVPKQASPQEASRNFNPFKNQIKSSLKIVGSEFENSWFWIFFEIRLENKPTVPVALVNDILLDIVERQSNTITFRMRGKRIAGRTSRKSRYLRIQESVFQQADSQLPLQPAGPAAFDPHCTGNGSGLKLSHEQHSTRHIQPASPRRNHRYR